MPDIEYLLKGIEVPLMAMIYSIHTHFPQKEQVLPTEQVVAAADNGVLLTVCRQLAHQLETDDFLSSNTLIHNEILLRSAMGSQYARMAGLVDNFDFDGAQLLLREFATLHQLDLDE